VAGSAALALKSGYCYIYISNESDELVYFDNLTLTHDKSSLMEETHYYPFGLVMAGISSKASGALQSKKKYNAGSELQNQEFSDGIGLEWYDVQARFYDPQIGRFNQIDPLPSDGGQECQTPYQYSLNNPISYNDPDGKIWNFIIGGILGAAVEYGTQVSANLISGRPLGDALTNVDGGSIFVAGVAGAITSGSSALIPKGTVATVAKQVALTALDAAESATKQYLETGDVSAKQVLTDVAANKVGGLIAGNVNSAAIKTSEKQLNRVEKIAAGDAASSGRQKAVSQAQNKIAAANAPKEAIGGIAGNSVSGIAAALQNTKQPKAPLIQPLNRSVSDATSAKIKLPPSLVQ
jgi:RHS repeat-associated protein